MAVDIIITLTTIDAGHSSTFDLYSDVDGFAVSFDLGISSAVLSAGYTTSAPDNTTTVRVCSTDNTCPNCVDLVAYYTTTTSTTLPPVDCNETIGSGFSGVTEYSIPLDYYGGIIVMDFDAYGIPDKLEIIHNGVKKATSGMTVANSGPFDDLYGDPTVPTPTEVLSVDQFIGTQKGVPPTREAEILADTGLIFTSTQQQLIWWEYTPSDVSVADNVIIRITGPSGTAWSLSRICDETTTTTTSTSSTTTTTTTITPTTTTTTTIAGLEAGTISSTTDLSDACSEVLDSIIFVDTQTPGTLTVGDIIYNDVGGNSIFVGNGNYYKIKITAGSSEFSARVNSSGEVLTPINICS